MKPHFNSYKDRTYGNKKTIFVETTKGYTLEDDVVSAGKNCALISKHFGLNNDQQTVSDFLKSSKADNMFDLCNAMQDGSIVISIPDHITSVLKNLK